MRPKHTSGPWTAWDTGNGIAVTTESFKDALVPNVAAFRDEIARLRPGAYDLETTKANALLIAAAPEMLAELQRIQTELLENVNADAELASRLYRIIQKALGREVKS